MSCSVLLNEIQYKKWLLSSTRRDRQTVFIIDNSCIMTIHIGKSSSFNAKAYYGFSAENRS